MTCTTGTQAPVSRKHLCQVNIMLRTCACSLVCVEKINKIIISSIRQVPSDVTRNNRLLKCAHVFKFEGIFRRGVVTFVSYQNVLSEDATAGL